MLSRVALALAVLASALSAGCAQAPQVRRDVVIGLVGEPLTALGEDPSARIVRGAITESLVRRDRDGAFVPRLAVAVPTLANGGLRVEEDARTLVVQLTATFEIRGDARWQDGVPVSAADVLLAHAEDRAAPPGTERRWMADRIERIEALGARLVRVVYRAGERWEQYALGPHVLPAHLLAGATADARAAYAHEPMHAGPFAIAAWVRGFGVTLAAFRDYVGGAPRLGRIEIRFFRDPGSLADALLRGDVDVVPSPSFDLDMIATLERLTDRERLLAQYTPAMSVEMLRIGRRGVLADASVRRAMLLALDRGGVVDALFGGRALVPRSYLTAPQPAAREVLPAARLDREGASALLASAGFSRGALGVLERGPERMAMTLLAGGSPARIEAGQRLVGDLSVIGVAVTLVEQAPEAVEAAVAAGDFDLALLPEAGDDPQRASERYRGWVDPWFDLLLSAAARSPEGDRAAAYTELQRLWAEALPGIPIYQTLRVDVAPRALNGVQPVPHGDPLTWNIADWSFAPEVN
ncbi:MAG TPA: ABC transporter substrate-binding protein [Candidatus Limnocylindria bacterium]|nr:ABC transporter substrate-binding protein [Candidatus Limnocylindria bacterium]